MLRARNVGLALVLLGALFIGFGYRTQPAGRLWLIAGVLLIIAGIIRVVRAARV